MVASEKKLEEINRTLNGDGLRARYEGAAPVSLKSRVDQVTGALWNTTSAPTKSFMDSYDVAANNFESILNSIQAVSDEIKKTEDLMEKNKAPFTPGRLPSWKKS